MKSNTGDSVPELVTDSKPDRVAQQHSRQPFSVMNIKSCQVEVDKDWKKSLLK